MANGYSVGNLELDIAAVDKSAASLSNVIERLQSMLNLVMPISNGFKSMRTNIGAAAKQDFSFDSGSSGGGKQQKKFDWKGVVGKLYVISNYTKRLRSYVSSMLTNAIEYTETLNLWQVAMRGNVDTAAEFITKMNEAYGIATQTLMQYQATFKNMLSSLGGISSNVSYSLSEYLTQMALDYASLYNTSIDKAMTVFQPVLSGQVRPIRSISGYDITETTIYELYQQLGGTKTMRQLTQTEKRLLRIYAVFQQMDRSGAIGDLSKTLNTSANQLRIMSESVKELGSWIGKLVEVYLAPALPYINAFFITATNIAKAIVKSLPDYDEFDGTIAGYEDTAEAMDEVQGKLLDFDKFRSLSSTEETSIGIGIDEKLIDGLSQYQSILNGVVSEAQILAKQWTAVFIDPETGEWTKEAKELGNAIKEIGKFVAALLLYNIGAKVVKFTAKLGQLAISMKGLNGFIGTSLIYTLLTLIEAIENGDTKTALFAGTIGVVIVGAYVAFRIAQAKATAETRLLTKELGTQQITMLGAGKAAGTLSTALLSIGAAVAMAVGGFVVFDGILNGLPATVRKTVSLLGIVFGALGAILGVILAIKEGIKFGLIGASIAGLGVGVMLAGIKGMASANAELQVRKNGGLVEDGLFTMNKGEIIGTFDDGTTVVANNQQIINGIKQGVYQAVSQALKTNTTTNTAPVDIYIDGEKVFQTTRKTANKHGLEFQKKG